MNLKLGGKYKLGEKLGAEEDNYFLLINKKNLHRINKVQFDY